MKNIFKHLNDLEIDIEEIEEIEVSAFDKARVKKELLKSIHAGKQKKWKKAVTAASLTLGLIASTLFGLSFTANAEEIPIIGNIYKYFNNDGLSVDYKENADPINAVAESNGIKVTVNDAVYDGEKLIVTYSIETNKYMGDTLHIKGIPLIENKGDGINEVSRIDENKYVGKATTFTEEKYSSIDVDWKLDYILSDLTTDKERITGDWQFSFHLDKANITVQNIQQHKEKEGISVTIENVTITPTSFLINYEQAVSKDILNEWDMADVDIEVKDNLGHRYVSTYHGGTGMDDVNMTWNKTFQVLNPEASKLIITPKVTLSNYDGVDYNTDGSIKGKYRLENSKADLKEFDMDEIIVEIEK
ncbi:MULTISPECIES: DUF4179 domain-containing protein [unclassified Lysinibacillus]|uniref:DUF4179 domain-containing protein n=1 Tax=unclassified Lysinibacillus TaxID=2636778 RepID=UPI003813502F